jgi:hypothetical protein
VIQYPAAIGSGTSVSGILDRLNRAMTWVGCLTVNLESIIAVVLNNPRALRCIIQNETTGQDLRPDGARDVAAIG